ncbi:MAG: glycosyltransferase family 4 protein [Patescibacteria group bacterium]|nr:glycosyltransferase family 4 protein [Patescibacteria group bacterium]
MKVGLICFHSFLNPGGVKRHVLDLHKELKKRDVETKIIIPRRKRSESYGKDVILLGTSFPINFTGSQADFNIHFDPIAIERTLKKEKFDILHFHNFGFPSILQILISPSASKSLNVLTFHANIKGNEFLENFPALIYFSNKISQWKIDGVIGVAPLNLEYFSLYSGLKKVIPNGIDLDKFNISIPKIKKFSDKKINMLFVGRIEERKGLIYLLKAFKILQKKSSNLRLIIVGEGPLEKECKKYVKDNDLKEVVFEGQVPKSLAGYYRTADIFISPAIFGESFGLVLLEAMACGAPVVAFANQGYKSFLKGKAAERFLVEPKDYKGLARKIEVLVNSQGLREKIAKKQFQEAKKYSWPKVTNQVLDFYRVCQEAKTKKRKNGFSLKNIESKIFDIANKDVSKWIDRIGK